MIRSLKYSRYWVYPTEFRICVNFPSVAYSYAAAIAGCLLNLPRIKLSLEEW